MQTQLALTLDDTREPRLYLLPRQERPGPFLLLLCVCFILPMKPAAWRAVYRLVRDTLTIDHELYFGLFAVEYHESAFKRRRFVIKHLGREFCELPAHDYYSIEPFQNLTARLLVAYGVDPSRAQLRYIYRPPYRLRRAGLRIVNAPLLRWSVQSVCGCCGRAFDAGNSPARRWCSVTCQRKRGR